MMTTVAVLAQAVGGRVCGDPHVTIRGAATLAQAEPGDLSFVMHERNLSELRATRASAVLVAPALANAIATTRPDLTIVEVAEPQLSFTDLLGRFRPMVARPPRVVSPQAFVDPTASVGPDCYVGPGASIGAGAVIGRGCDIYPGAHIGAGCRLGEDVTVHPNAVLYHNVEVGDRTIIHSTAVIGADGFGYRFEQGRFLKVPQLGDVRLEADVEIGAGTTIDRAAVGTTVIGAGSKIDNQVQIGHNCEIGAHNVFAAQAGLAGSCKTGSHVRLGGQVGIKDHCYLGDGSSVGAKGGVHKDIPAGETWIGYPATPEQEQKRLLFSLKRVPDLRDEFKLLRQEVARLTEELAQLKQSPTTPRDTLRAVG